MKSIRENPTAGLVVRYDYLWKREFLGNKSEGAKNRPCAVVVPMTVGPDNILRVILAAITHSPPQNASDAIEIPLSAKRAIGLDSVPSWIVVDEVNIVDWTDAGFVPATDESWNYGYLPKQLVSKVINEVSIRAKAGTLFKVPRE
jgi:mRNA-degrading endonuclease toxin of MazEF toxin-antitoxin module